MNKRALSFLSSTTLPSTGEAGGGAWKIICSPVHSGEASCAECLSPATQNRFRSPLSLVFYENSHLLPCRSHELPHILVVDNAVYTDDEQSCSRLLFGETLNLSFFTSAAFKGLIKLTVTPNLCKQPTPSSPFEPHPCLAGHVMMLPDSDTAANGECVNNFFALRVYLSKMKGEALWRRDLGRRVKS